MHKNSKTAGSSHSTKGHPSSSNADSTSAQTIKDAETYNRLLAIGMPSAITLEDFERIMNLAASPPSAKGKTTKSLQGSIEPNASNEIRRAIEFLSVHLVGRDEARRLRGCISRAREMHEQTKESRPTSRIKAPVIHTTKGADILDNPLTAAIARRDMAYRNLESVRREYAVEAEKCGALDKQKRELVKELDEKRRIELQLRILEKREIARLKRIGLGDGSHKGIGTLVNELRKESDLAVRQLRLLVFESAKSAPQPPPALTMVHINAALKYKRTTEALANLHALHIRSRREMESEGEVVVARLESVLGRLGVKDKTGVDMTTTLVAVARRRAAARHEKALETLRGRASKVDESRLSAMHAANEEKRRELQTKINRAVALGWVCEGYIDLVSTFRSDTAPTLHATLDAEQKRVEGHVDALRTTIMQTPSKADASFTQEVRVMMGTTCLSLADEVREMLAQVGVSEKMVGIPPQVASGGDWPEIRVDVERTQTLLERKATKMEYGFGIAEEMKAMLGDVRRLK